MRLELRLELIAQRLESIAQSSSRVATEAAQSGVLSRWSSDWCLALKAQHEVPLKLSAESSSLRVASKCSDCQGIRGILELPTCLSCLVVFCARFCDSYQFAQKWRLQHAHRTVMVYASARQNIA